VKSKNPLDEDPQLHIPRIIQSKLLPDRLDLFRRGQQSTQDFRRIAAPELEQEEDEQDDADQRRDHLPQSA